MVTQFPCPDQLIQFPSACSNVLLSAALRSHHNGPKCFVLPTLSALQSCLSVARIRKAARPGHHACERTPGAPRRRCAAGAHCQGCRGESQSIAAWRACGLQHGRHRIASWLSSIVYGHLHLAPSSPCWPNTAGGHVCRSVPEVGASLEQPCVPPDMEKSCSWQLP